MPDAFNQQQTEVCMNAYLEQTIEEVSKQELESQVTRLDWLHHIIAQYQREREVCESSIVTLLNHTIKGQKTYTVGQHAVEIVTGLNFSLDKKKYEEFGEMLPNEFNPVQVKESYYLDKKKIELCRERGCAAYNEILDEMITTKDKKLSVKIYAAKGSK